MPFTYYIVLEHVFQRAGISDVFCGIEIEACGRILRVHGLCAERQNQACKHIQMVHFGYPYSDKGIGNFLIAALFEIYRMINILQNCVQLAFVGGIRGRNNSQAVSVGTNSVCCGIGLICMYGFRHNTRYDLSVFLVKTAKIHRLCVT